MAKIYANPKQRSRITADANGALYYDRQQTDIADPGLGLGTLAVGDSVQVGVVPAGHVLVPELSGISVPQLDTNASATGKVSIGTADDTAVLLAATTVGSAISKGIGDFAADVAIGDAENDTPIVLVVTAANATQATTGTIVANLVLRAFDAGIDG